MRDFFDGMKLLGLGQRAVIRRPRLVLLGMIPPILALILFAGLWAVLIYFYGDLVGLASWYARDWESGFWRGTVEVMTGVALAAVAGLLTIVSFTAVTLLIGDPFYEKISASIEDIYGGVKDEVEWTWWQSLGRSIVDSLRLVLLMALFAIPLLVVGLVPFVGPVVGALVGGWFLAVELVGIPFYRRGLRLRDRRQMLRPHRKLTMGFGFAVFLCFLIPLGTIVVMPAAVAGGTLLTRRVFGLPIDK